MDRQKVAEDYVHILIITRKCYKNKCLADSYFILLLLVMNSNVPVLYLDIAAGTEVPHNERRLGTDTIRYLSVTALSYIIFLFVCAFSFCVSCNLVLYRLHVT
jgi:hypothetical protein